MIKEDGLAGGKGVTIAQNQDVAEETIREMFAGGQTAVVLEECLVGPEYSMFVVVSEDQFTILPMAQDHKRVGDGDKGPNTGGMGSYSPLPNDEWIGSRKLPLLRYFVHRFNDDGEWSKGH